MPALTFLEVDAEDVAGIRARFPDAQVIQTPLRKDGNLKKCAESEILSCFIYSKIDAKELRSLPRLKLLCTRSVGTDHIDLAACAARGVTVCNVPDYGSHVIAEHVFALVLGTLRHIHEADRRVEEGKFDYHGLRGMALRGKTIGIAGTGKIGRRVARIANGFGMRILAMDTVRSDETVDLLGARYVALDELLRESDILTLHLPLLDATTHVINAEAFAKMKDGVVLVNTARGGLVDTEALVSALKSGKVLYALLDVLEHEKDYESNRELIDHPRAITTPHIAFYADDSMRNMFHECFESIAGFRRGETPRNAVGAGKLKV